MNKMKANTSLDTTNLDSEIIKPKLPFVNITLEESPKLNKEENKVDADYLNNLKLTKKNLSNIKSEMDEDS